MENFFQTGPVDEQLAHPRGAVKERSSRRRAWARLRLPGEEPVVHALVDGRGGALVPEDLAVHDRGRAGLAVLPVAPLDQIRQAVPLGDEARPLRQQRPLGRVIDVHGGAPGSVPGRHPPVDLRVAVEGAALPRRRPGRLEADLPVEGVALLVGAAGLPQAELAAGVEALLVAGLLADLVDVELDDLEDRLRLVLRPAAGGADGGHQHEQAGEDGAEHGVSGQVTHGLSLRVCF